MKRIVIWVLLAIIPVGCAGPTFTGSSVKDITNRNIVIINDKETRAGFQQTMETWLKKNGYQYSVVPDGSAQDPEKLSLEYVGHWSWDLALYLSSATIAAYDKGQKVGFVDFRAPDTLNTNKFGSGEERIGWMMDLLFGRITVDEANNLLKGTARSAESK